MSTADLHYLYFAYDTWDELLYIGVTNDFELRMRQHSQSAAWWKPSVRVEVQEQPNRATALIRERDLIASERPVYNVQHNRDSTPWIQNKKR